MILLHVIINLVLVNIIFIFFFIINFNNIFFIEGDTTNIVYTLLEDFLGEWYTF